MKHIIKSQLFVLNQTCVVFPTTTNFVLHSEFMIWQQIHYLFLPSQTLSLYVWCYITQNSSATMMQTQEGSQVVHAYSIVMPRDYWFTLLPHKHSLQKCSIYIYIYIYIYTIGHFYLKNLCLTYGEQCVSYTFNGRLAMNAMFTIHNADKTLSHIE